jgi:hypothetical protein
MLSRASAALALVCVLSAPAAARADAVLDWNAIAVSTYIANGQSPFAQARLMAITQLAVFEAVNAITGDYQPYLGTISALPGASAEAAAIAAAHAVILNYFPGSAATIDPLRAASLAALPDAGKLDGIAVGEAAAAAMIAKRLNDGSAPAQLFTPPTPGPGVWEGTPSCPRDAAGNRVGALLHWRNVTPFAIGDVSKFILPRPPKLMTAAYAADYAEVMRVGDAAATLLDRPADRADVARFYAAASPAFLFNSAARQVAFAQGRSVSDNARSLALINMASSDALVASFWNKYHYNLWRPETAIRADNDGNPQTDANVSFMPYIVTPCFPSYPSNHASGSSSAARMLELLYGRDGHNVTLTNVGITLNYTAFSQMTADVDDARVYGGIHFRFDQVGGNILGGAVAKRVFMFNLTPVKRRITE